MVWLKSLVLVAGKRWSYFQFGSPQNPLEMSTALHTKKRLGCDVTKADEKFSR